MKTDAQVELLSPAGSYEGMEAVFAAGADAVYIGGQRFGARAYADNPDEEGLKRAINHAHEKKKKLYLTVNTLLKDRELEDLYGFLNPLYREGLDAVIVQDLGVLRYVRDVFPKLHIHASTQMGITGPYGAQFLKEQGASRVVTARELSLAEIRAVHEKTDVEIESFVHGALCFCYSGQCLLSSMIGGRSGNRGRCAQPCRLPYELIPDRQDSQESRGYSQNKQSSRELHGHAQDRGAQQQRQASCLLSPKDICTLDILPELVESGISSFKIEGRMKREEYAAGVTSIYRRCIDCYYAAGGAASYYVAPDEKRELLILYNRGGFSEGYYKQHNGPEMMSFHSSDHHRSAQEKESGRGAKSAAQEKENGRAAKSAAQAKESAGAAKSAAQDRAHYEALLQELRQKFICAESAEKINGKLILSAQKPAILKLYYGNYKTETEGQAPQAAKSRPLLKADVERQLRKTGGSGFVFEELSIDMEEGLFLPVQAINELRRAAIAELRERIAVAHRREDGAYRPPEPAAQTRDAERAVRAGQTEKISRSPEPAAQTRDAERAVRAEQTGNISCPPEPAAQTRDAERAVGAGQTQNISRLAEECGSRSAIPLTASIENAECLPALCRVPGISRIYLDCNSFESREQFLRDSRERIGLCHRSGQECWYILPWIFRREALEFFDERALSALTEYDGVLLRNQEEYAFLKAHGFAGKMAADWNLYTFNREAEAFWRGMGLVFDTASPELNRRELAARGCAGSELIVYGYQQLMVSAQCQVKNVYGCRRQPTALWLRDRMKKQFAVRNHCLFCYNTIANSAPLELIKNADDIRRLAPLSVRLQFTAEDAGTAEKTARDYAEVFVQNRPSEREILEFTRGHFERGVE